MNTVKKEDLIPGLLKRVEFIDDKFIGYTGEKYIYILDVLVSQINGTIINKYWILNKVDEETFIRISNNGGGFTFETAQIENIPMVDINGEPVYFYDQNGEPLTETISIENGVDENGDPIFIQSERKLLRINEFSRNVNQFVPILGDSISITIRRCLGEKI